MSHDKKRLLGCKGGNQAGFGGTERARGVRPSTSCVRTPSPALTTEPPKMHKAPRLSQQGRAMPGAKVRLGGEGGSGLSGVECGHRDHTGQF